MPMPRSVDAAVSPPMPAPTIATWGANVGFAWPIDLSPSSLNERASSRILAQVGVKRAQHAKALSTRVSQSHYSGGAYFGNARPRSGLVLPRQTAVLTCYTAALDA